ncbi:hypothetical protein ABIA96_007188 [Bradyrhizobium sp. LB11.1]
MADKDTHKQPSPPSKPSREEEARQVVQEYIDDQRELQRKLANR